jgi:pimeloyl-ACP methyl ester carboxylesterase
LRRIPRRFITIPALYIAVFLMVSLAGCADRLLLHPSRRAISPSLGDRATIPWEGRSLDVIRARSGEDPTQVRVLVFTGNAGRAEFEIRSAARLFEECAAELIALNPPGYGKSDGDARLSDLLPSALAVYDALRAENAQQPIVVYGNSMGGAVALGVAARRDVSLVVLRNPPPLRQMILQRHGWWNLWLLALPVAFAVPSELDALENANLATAPAIFLRAERDEVVPVDFQADIEAEYGGEKVLVVYPGGHNDGLADAAISECRGEIAQRFAKPR